MFETIERVDARDKVTGRARYTDDLCPPGMVYACMVRSDVAHGHIVSIDADEALAIDGVLGVLTHRDIPGIAGKEKERPVLAAERVRFAGEGIAMVVAETDRAARRAAERVRVSMEELAAVFTPDEALAEDAPRLHGSSNLETTVRLRHGDVSRGFAESDVIVERELSTQRVQHAAIEPESALCVPHDDHVELYCAPKSPFNVRRVVSETLGTSVNRVRLISAAVGGSFGGKDYDMSLLGSRVALAAHHFGRPVKMTYTREESIIEGTKRHPYRMTYRLGALHDGTLKALEVTVRSDAGAYLSKSAMVAWRSCVESGGPYRIPHVSTDVHVVYTNQIYSDSLRGFGSPQVDFALEVVMDELARALSMDPLALRRRNVLRDGDEHASGQVVSGVSMERCLDALQEKADYDQTLARIERFNEAQGDGPLRRGFGIAALHRGEALGSGGEGIDTAGVNVQIEKDASVIIYCGLSEVGQGCQTMLVRIVSELLGIEPARCRVSRLDTDYVPDSGPTVASRGTVLAGNAAVDAVANLKERIHEALEDVLPCTADEQLIYQDGWVRLKNRPERAMRFEDAVRAVYARSQSLYGQGWWAAPKLVWDWERGQGDAYFNFVYGACGCELEIDTETGQSRVVRFLAVHDVGTALNIEEVSGQISGGVAMGIGYALMEEVQLRGGIIRNTNLDGYLLPTALDTGCIEPVILQEHSPIGPLGAKGLGEPVTSIVAPAIANAAARALSRPMLHLPLNLERMLAAARKEDLS